MTVRLVYSYRGSNAQPLCGVSQFVGNLSLSRKIPRPLAAGIFHYERIYGTLKVELNLSHYKSYVFSNKF